MSHIWSSGHRDRVTWHAAFSTGSYHLLGQYSPSAVFLSSDCWPVTGLGLDSLTFYRRWYPLGAQTQLSHWCSPWRKSQKTLNLQKKSMGKMLATSYFRGLRRENTYRLIINSNIFFIMLIYCIELISWAYCFNNYIMYFYLF